MRVIAGQFRSRGLAAPPGNATRPTSDRLRETLFNVLAPRIVDSHFADLYAGSGAVGIEALSRGAASCFFVERAPAAVQVLQKNVLTLELSGKSKLDSRSVTSALQDAVRDGRTFDIVFLDPPYESAGEYTATLESLGEQHKSLLATGAIVIAEHAKRMPLLPFYAALVRYRLLEQGDAALAFYRVEAPVKPATR